MGLKELTKEVHQDAERQEFVKTLMSGNMSDEMYAEFLYNQHAIYNLLEACAMSHGLLNDFPQIRRAPSILADFQELWKKEDMPKITESTERYIKHMYTIKEDITISRRLSLNENRISLSIKEYYETDGIFCSFNCCKAFINDNKHKNIYNHSLTLLTKMYNDMLGTTVSVIDTAPHWRNLEEYGGHLSISEFRNSFSKADYEEHGIIRNIPSYRSVGFLYEEKIKF